jgi:hypothetical protein
MGITKEELEKRFPGVRISGELNPDIPDEQWLFSVGFAQQVINYASAKTAKTQKLYVYLLQRGSENIFKVGITTNVEKRVNAIQANHPDVLRVIKSVAHERAQSVEQSILSKLEKFSIRGGWVRCDKTIVMKAFNTAIREHQSITDVE